MVYLFTSNTVEPAVLIYMGENENENDTLIEIGRHGDVWFHISKISSAHVYLRLPEGMDIDMIPEQLLEDCCQLVKANSIKGNKLNDVSVVFTSWSNLKKTKRMDVGQVGFHDEKLVKQCTVEQRLNAIVNRLDKTRRKHKIDMRAQKKERDRPHG
ncbi:hypothetical protein PENTCL1PPCAC_3418 [Pristionchus entomophagus]|uniref:Coiled-coil domain-containing protein 25 n=1 Tax=Pristionchus entomophagus TaxID=358040 RepID=A0AAV5SDU8_9BILA|nr:hypothetical protein PENTCL1PPCAC_3418 [Pristionchus entomophagus]